MTFQSPRVVPPVAVAATALAFLAFHSATARADMTRAQCIDANAQAQSLRRDEKLAQARELLRACSDPKCPGMVVADCTKRLDELEAAQPTIVFEAKDPAGRELNLVKVTADERPLADTLDGTPFTLDPGDHTFTFEVDGQPAVTLHFTLTEGQKARRESIVIGQAQPPPAPATAPVGDAPEAPASPADPPRPLRTAGIAAGAAGLAGIAAGTVFGLMASSKWSSQKSACASSADCPNHAEAVSDHSSLTTDATISTIAFIAGGALLAGGVTLFVLGSRPESEGTALVVAPNVGGAALALKGWF
jgi:hypothetical protein